MLRHGLSLLTITSNIFVLSCFTHALSFAAANAGVNASAELAALIRSSSPTSEGIKALAAIDVRSITSHSLLKRQETAQAVPSALQADRLNIDQSFLENGNRPHVKPARFSPGSSGRHPAFVNNNLGDHLQVVRQIKRRQAREMRDHLSNLAEVGRQIRAENETIAEIQRLQDQASAQSGATPVGRVEGNRIQFSYGVNSAQNVLGKASTSVIRFSPTHNVGAVTGSGR